MNVEALNLILKNEMQWNKSNKVCLCLIERANRISGCLKTFHILSIHEEL